MKKRFFLFLPLLGMLLGGCSGGINPVTGISLDKTELSIMETESYSLSVSIEPKKATNQIIKWETSNPNIATVSTGGVVTGVSTGTADVKVITEDGGYTATCAVTVTPYVPVITHVTNIALSKQSIKLEPSASETVTYTVFPEDASEKGVTISSSNEEVVTVEDLGNNHFKINAVNEGKAAVLVISKDTPEEGKLVIDGSVAVDVYKEDDPSVIHVSSVGLSSPSASMLPNEDVDVTYTVYPSDATDKSVIVTNSDESVASISHEPSTNTISIHSIKNGTTTITVTANDKPHGKVIKSSIVVNVHDPIPVTGVILSSKSEQLNVGDNCTLIETVLPTDATNKNVTWESSDSSVASVENGVVSAKSIGTANISVVTEDGGFSDTCVVTVSERVCEYVYFTNNKSWDEVYCHYWGSSLGDTTWPGVECEFAYINENDENVYSVVVPDDVSGLIFNNNDNGQQTNNIEGELLNKQAFYCDGDSSPYGVGTWEVKFVTVSYNLEGGTGTAPADHSVYYHAKGMLVNDGSEFTKGDLVFKYWVSNLAEPEDCVKSYIGTDGKTYIDTTSNTVPAGGRIELHAVYGEAPIADGYYIVGNMTDWNIDPTLMMNYDDQKDEYSLAVTLEVDDEFKVLHHDNEDGDSYYGYEVLESGEGSAKDAGQIVAAAVEDKPNMKVSYAGTYTSYFKVSSSTIWIGAIEESHDYKIKVNEDSYELVVNPSNPNEYMTAEAVDLSSGDVLAYFKDEVLQTATPKAIGNNNCFNNEGVTTVCLDLEGKIYVDIEANTIFCAGLDCDKFYLSVNNKPSLLTKNTQSEGNEYMLFGYTFNNNDLIKCVDTNSSNSNAVVFAIKKVDSASISGFSVVNDGIKYSGSSVTADVYVKFIMNDDQIYFGPSNA